MALKQRWLNDGKQVDGYFHAQIVDADRNDEVVSNFKGKTMLEVADKILESQTQSSQKIRELKANRAPDRAPQSAPIKPKELTADDRFRMQTELMNPENAPDVLEEFVTSAVGASPKAIGEALARQQQRELEAYMIAEGTAFRESHPSYYPCDDNLKKLYDGLALKGYDFTRNNLAIVYDELSAQGLLIEAPAPSTPGTHEDDNPSQEPNPPRPTRNRMVSATAIRDANASATRPAAAKPPAITRAQIDAMPRAEYQAKLRDPAFRQAVDNLPR